MLRSNALKSPLNHVLYQLFWLRSAIIIFQIVTIYIAVDQLGIELPVEELSHPIFLTTVFNIFLSWRLIKGYQSSESEIFINLAFDSIILGLIIYYSGGPSNPFLSILLVPLAIAAAFISIKYVLALALVCFGIYSFLMFEHHHVPSLHHHRENDFDLHLIGMWINFMLSSMVIVSFIASIASHARKKQQQLTENEQQQMRDEYIISLGTLAAGTAHEISTPLSNIGMMADELKDNPEDKKLVAQFSASIKQQQQHCVKQLDVLRNAAEQARYNLSEENSLHDYLAKLISQWSAMRPEIALSKDMTKLENLNVSMDQTISHSIYNLLNNSADASLSNGSNAVCLYPETRKDTLLIHIDDHGPGLSDEFKNKAENIMHSTKPKGFGIGLLLSHSSLSRYEGSIKLQQRDHGVRTTICIPLKKIKVA